MRTILVEPEHLERTANSVDEANSEYVRLYKAMYAEVDKMQASWQGKDNTAFTNQIKSFEDDLRQISLIMKQFSEFLKNTARGYRETQQELYAQANRLKT